MIAWWLIKHEFLCPVVHSFFLNFLTCTQGGADLFVPPTREKTNPLLLFLLTFMFSLAGVDQHYTPNAFFSSLALSVPNWVFSLGKQTHHFSPKGCECLKSFLFIPFTAKLPDTMAFKRLNSKELHYNYLHPVQFVCPWLLCKGTIARIVTSIFVIVGIPWSLTCAAMVMFHRPAWNKTLWWHWWHWQPDTEMSVEICRSFTCISNRAVNLDKIKSLISGQSRVVIHLPTAKNVPKSSFLMSTALSVLTYFF